MTTTLFPITDETSWLAKRQGYVTSTEASALFGINPYVTAFELYHQKRGNLTQEVTENNFMLFGKLMEDTICQMILKEKPKWEIKPFAYFAHDDIVRIGSSFDRLVLIDDVIYPLEIKTTSYKQFKSKWLEDEDTLEAPPQYEVQMQMEMELYGADRLLLVVFIADTRTLKYIWRERDYGMMEGIKLAVEDFWALTEPPEPDYARDKRTIGRTMPASDGSDMDATTDNRMTELVSRYKAAKAAAKRELEEADECYAEIMHRAGSAKRIFTNSHRVTVSDIKASEGTLITEDMIGERYGAKAGYKRLTVTELK